MQQQQGGVGSQSQYGEITPSASGTAVATHMLVGGIDQSQQQQQQQLVEAASPISSRPPATGNLDELMRLSAVAAAGGSGLADEDEGERGGGVSGGNRWPRQETLALLKIRSDMDAAFRDATIKGPLWEDVSRKLADLGYKRNAKKCKEKFENVHKYYKRTKEGRAGRQDGKSYKFFSQLEALHSTATSSHVSSSPAMPLTTVTTSLDVAPVSIGIPMPISSSVRIQPSILPQLHSTIGMSSSIFPPNPGAPTIPGAVSAPPPATTSTPIGISFSSNSSSSSPSTEDDDDDDEFEGEPSNTAGSSRKRKRQSSKGGGGGTHRMMEFFESLMKQVMQKQEGMQQRFLEAIEKREQDRMIREEAWKRQEMARLAREHELMAQERAISASRDAAIISFLQKITGQTIQLPTQVVTINPVAPPQPAVPAATLSPMPTPSPPQPPPSLPQQQQQQPHRHHQHQHQQQQQQVRHHHFHQQSQNVEVVRHQPPVSSEIVMAVPEQQIPPQDTSGGGGSGSFEPTSSRWPKVEVLALIKLRSGLESKYQEAGPKGPLWEEISAGMQRMGYKRSAKRCKEKWENINKYFKKVKESNKKRPEDAKTCPYFHELDALYRKKILGSSSGGGGDTSTSQAQPPQQQQESINLNPIPSTDPQGRSDVSAIVPTAESKNKNGGSANVPGSLFGEGEGDGGAAKKPEDIVKELMEQQGMQQLIVEDEYDKIEEPDSDNIDHEEDEDEDDDEDDEELEEESKMGYKIEFQRQNTSASNGGGNGAASFLAMVQ